MKTIAEYDNGDILLLDNNTLNLDIGEDFPLIDVSNKFFAQSGLLGFRVRELITICIKAINKDMKSIFNLITNQDVIDRREAFIRDLKEEERARHFEIMEICWKYMKMDWDAMDNVHTAKPRLESFAKEIEELFN